MRDHGTTRLNVLLAIVAAIGLVLLVADLATAGSNHHSVTCTDDAGNPVNVECGQGDTTVVCPSLTCPATPACPDITIQSRVLRCSRVKALKNGTTIGRRCLLVTEGTTK